MPLSIIYNFKTVQVKNNNAEFCKSTISNLLINQLLSFDVSMLIFNTGKRIGISHMACRAKSLSLLNLKLFKIFNLLVLFFLCIFNNKNMQKTGSEHTANSIKRHSRMLSLTYNKNHHQYRRKSNCTMTRLHSSSNSGSNNKHIYRSYKEKKSLQAKIQISRIIYMVSSIRVKPETNRNKKIYGKNNNLEN